MKQETTSPAGTWVKTIKQLLVGFVLLSVSFILFCEIYDHVPNRSWIYRQTHTTGFAEVTAKIEVDGEPMMLTRTIRCIKQPRPWAQSFTGASPDDSSVFDALGGVSKSGRTIVVNVEKACGRLDLASRRNELPFHLGPTDDGRPPVLEPVGNSYLPDVIYSYTDDALQEGRYGIRLIEVNIQESAIKSRMFDGGQYDWIGGGGWYSGDDRPRLSYISREIEEWPKDMWAASSRLTERIKGCTKPCILRMLLPEFQPIQSEIFKSGQWNPTPYPAKYINGAFYPQLDKPGLYIATQLPKGYEAYDNGLTVSTYDFGGGPVKVTSNDHFYISQDERVFLLGGGAGITVRR